MDERDKSIRLGLADPDRQNVSVEGLEVFSDVSRWLEIAERLWICAQRIEGVPTSYLVEALEFPESEPTTLKARVQGVLLLLGFAAENAVKAAYLLDHRPVPKGNGINLKETFPGKKAHDLVAIASQSILQEAVEDPETRAHLEQFTQVIRWSGRYPFSADVNSSAWLQIRSPKATHLVFSWIQTVRQELNRRRE